MIGPRAVELDLKPAQINPVQNHWLDRDTQLPVVKIDINFDKLGT